jgi:hypothetical protein
MLCRYGSMRAEVWFQRLISMRTRTPFVVAAMSSAFDRSLHQSVSWREGGS